jgi:hypothetical protein
MLVGDAAGQTAPLWGEGIGYAMRAGRMAGQIAADAVADGHTSRDRLLAYERSWQESYGEKLSAQRRRFESRLMADEPSGRRISSSDRFTDFGPYAEIAAQFSHLRYPISNAEELVAQCGGVGRTFLFQGRVLRLGQGLTRLPYSFFPLESWADVTRKMAGWLAGPCPGDCG